MAHKHALWHLQWVAELHFVALCDFEGCIWPAGHWLHCRSDTKVPTVLTYSFMPHMRMGLQLSEFSLPWNDKASHLAHSRFLVAVPCSVIFSPARHVVHCPQSVSSPPVPFDLTYLPSEHVLCERQVLSVDSVAAPLLYSLPLHVCTAWQAVSWWFVRSWNVAPSLHGAHVLLVLSTNSPALHVAMVVVVIVVVVMVLVVSFVVLALVVPAVVDPAVVVPGGGRVLAPAGITFGSLPNLMSWIHFTATTARCPCARSVSHSHWQLPELFAVHCLVHASAVLSVCLTILEP